MQHGFSSCMQPSLCTHTTNTHTNAHTCMYSCTHTHTQALIHLAVPQSPQCHLHLHPISTSGLPHPILSLALLLSKSATTTHQNKRGSCKNRGRNREESLNLPIYTPARPAPGRGCGGVSSPQWPILQSGSPGWSGHKRTGRQRGPQVAAQRGGHPKVLVF